MGGGGGGGGAGALQSERSQLTRCSLDLISNLAQLYPEAVLQAVFGKWQELAARWLQGFAEAGIGGSGPVRGGGALGEKLAWVARDASCVLQLWGVLFDMMFGGQGFESRFEFATSVVGSLLEFGEYCATYGEEVESVCGEVTVLYLNRWVLY